MNVGVNITNYEAIYLDFLEGNLSQELTDALFVFLENNPELKIDEDLPEFILEQEIKLENTFLNSLKVIDASETITLNNYQRYMIAAIENDLAATKQIELNDFIRSNPQFKSEFEGYKKTILVADTSLVYPNKSSLKKGFIIPMYAKYIFAAASVLFIFMLLQFNSSNIENKDAIASISFFPEKTIKNNNSQTPQINHSTRLAFNQENDKQLNRIEGENTFEEKDQINTLSAKKITKFNTVTFPKEIESLDIALTNQLKASTNVNQTENNQDYAYIGFKEMKNPVPFITNGIKNKLNKEVDFRTAKANTKKQGGFFLKIGKLEISRKTHIIQEELAIK